MGLTFPEKSPVRVVQGCSVTTTTTTTTVTCTDLTKGSDLEESWQQSIMLTCCLSFRVSLAVIVSCNHYYSLFMFNGLSLFVTEPPFPIYRLPCVFMGLAR